MKQTATTFYSGLALVLGAGHAAALTINCPESITIAEKVTTEYPSWEVTADKGKVAYYLESIRVYAGHPEQMGNLIPDKSERKNGKVMDTWTLARPTEQDGYWVACAYRNSMTLLIRRIPDNLNSCTVVQKTRPSGAMAGIESFSCA